MYFKYIVYTKDGHKGIAGFTSIDHARMFVRDFALGREKYYIYNQDDNIDEDY